MLFSGPTGYGDMGVPALAMQQAHVMTRALMVQLVFLEAGDHIHFEQRPLDMRTGEHESEGYRALNPSGLIPTLLTPSGQALYETPAIMLYLAEQHDLTELAPSVGDPLRGLFLSALFYIAGELHPHCKRMLYPSRYSLNERDWPHVVQQARLAAFERIQTIETR
eukprot:COSAG02_NODE_3539_length_6589_cov_3.693066_7_plen_164_part_01